MADFQFTVKNSHEQFLSKVNDFIKKHPTHPSFDAISTKDGTVYMLEFKEQYQLDSFNQEFSSTFAYLFVQ